MKKKAIAFLLAAVTLLSLAGCGDGGKEAEYQAKIDELNARLEAMENAEAPAEKSVSAETAGSETTAKLPDPAAFFGRDYSYLQVDIGGSSWQMGFRFSGDEERDSAAEEYIALLRDSRFGLTETGGGEYYRLFEYQDGSVEPWWNGSEWEQVGVYSASGSAVEIVYVNGVELVDFGDRCSAQPAPSGPVSTPADDPRVMTDEEVLAAGKDEPIVFDAYLQYCNEWDENGYITAYALGTFDCGYRIDKLECSRKEAELLRPGVKVRVSSSEHDAGSTRIKTATAEVIPGDTYIAPPVDVTGFLVADPGYLSEYEYRLVSFTGMKVEELPFGGGLVQTSKDGARASFWRTESFLSPDEYSTCKSLQIGDIVDFSGYLEIAGQSYVMIARSFTLVSSASTPEPTPTPTSTPTPKPTPTPTPTPKPTPTPAVTGPVLPCPDEFFHNQLGRNEDVTTKKEGVYSLKYYFALKEGEDPAGEYLELLKDSRFHLSCVDTETHETKSKYTVYSSTNTYYFAYTGTGSVGVTEYRGKDKDIPVNLHVEIYKNYVDDDRVWLTITYSSDFTFEDFGDRSTVTEFIDYSGKASSGVPDSPGYQLPDASRLPCLTCGGSGDCKTCGGYGKVRGIYSGVETTCKTCYGDGKCRTCGGTGHRS